MAAAETCTVCGKTLGDGLLLYGEEGRVCMACDADLAEEKAVFGTVLSRVFGAPLLGGAASVALLSTSVPYLGIFGLAAAAFLGVWGVVEGVRALVLATERGAVGPLWRLALVVNGGSGLLWCLAIAVVGLGGLLWNLGLVLWSLSQVLLG